MSGPFDAVDLGLLPPPDVVETLDYEAILAALKADFIARWPAFDALLESEPAVKLMEVAAYRELLLRARINDAARAVMLATATGADLDHLTALLGVGRQVLDPGDPDAAPPVPPTLEADAALRRRAQLALEAATAAGTAGRYVWHALRAPGVADAAATSPAPGEVLISVLGPDGAPTQAMLDAVEAIVLDPEVRQLCDTVTVAPAGIVETAITAVLTVRPGPGDDVALATARARLEARAHGERRLGRGLPRSAIFAALTVEGVEKVTLTAPAADVAATATQAVKVTAITLSLAP